MKLSLEDFLEKKDQFQLGESDHRKVSSRNSRIKRISEQRP